MNEKPKRNEAHSAAPAEDFHEIGFEELDETSQRITQVLEKPSAPKPKEFQRTEDLLLSLSHISQGAKDGKLYLTEGPTSVRIQPSGNLLHLEIHENSTKVATSTCRVIDETLQPTEEGTLPENITYQWLADRIFHGEYHYYSAQTNTRISGKEAFTRADEDDPLLQ